MALLAVEVGELRPETVEGGRRRWLRLLHEPASDVPQENRRIRAAGRQGSAVRREREAVDSLARARELVAQPARHRLPYEKVILLGAAGGDRKREHAAVR